MFLLRPKDQVLMLERRDVVLIIGKITICKAIHHEAISHLHIFAADGEVLHINFFISKWVQHNLQLHSLITNIDSEKSCLEDYVFPVKRS